VTLQQFTAADEGAPAVVLAFHPFFQDDFTWNCEGLSKWGNRPAWIVRFKQRADRSNRLASFQSSSDAYPLPLKGRAWITEKGGQVMHIETDLVNPIAAVRLNREHFVIDYQPITFQTHKVTLWLPQNVDVYYQYRGHYLHHYHRYSQFKLFWTGSSQKIGKPEGSNTAAIASSPRSCSIHRPCFQQAFAGLDSTGRLAYCRAKGRTIQISAKTLVRSEGSPLRSI
jgi:hypothetical protein